jgi:integrase
MSKKPVLIARVTRCSTRSFVGASRLPEPDVPTFGSFCKASAQRGQSEVIGLIFDIRIEDDELARQIAIASDPPKEQLADNRLSRLIPIEISCLAVGYRIEDEYRQRIPPQPPMTLDEVYALTDAEVRDFSARLDFIPLVFAAPGLAADDLLSAALQHAAHVRPDKERRGFLIEAGRICAKQLSVDLPRLERLVRSLTP